MSGQHWYLGGTNAEQRAPNHESTDRSSSPGHLDNSLPSPGLSVPIGKMSEMFGRDQWVSGQAGSSHS